MVASFTDAWIETGALSKERNIIKVASFTDAWIETKVKPIRIAGKGRIFYRCVD